MKTPDRRIKPAVMGEPTPARPGVWNGHADISAPTVNGFTRRVDGLHVPKNHLGRFDSPTVLLLDRPDGSHMNQADQWDLPRAREGREKLVGAVAFINPADAVQGNFGVPDKLYPQYRKHHDVYSRLIDESNGGLVEVSTAADLNGVLTTDGQIGLVRSVEGIYGDFTMKDVDRMMADGVVIWDIMWNHANENTGKPSSMSGTDDDDGLTRKGTDLVKHLVKSGMVIDVSHASDRTSHDVMKIIELNDGRPAIATHSGSREVTQSKRNLPDDVARRIGEQGGMIGIPFVKTFVDSTEGAARHAEHFAEMGLLGNVVTGSDFDGIAQSSVVPGLETPDVAYTNLETALRDRGFTADQVDGIYLGNAVRYMQQNLPR